MTSTFSPQQYEHVAFLASKTRHRLTKAIPRFKMARFKQYITRVAGPEVATWPVYFATSPQECMLILELYKKMWWVNRKTFQEVGGKHRFATPSRKVEELRREWQQMVQDNAGAGDLYAYLTSHACCWNANFNYYHFTAREMTHASVQACDGGSYVLKKLAVATKVKEPLQRVFAAMSGLDLSVENADSFYRNSCSSFFCQADAGELLHKGKYPFSFEECWIPVNQTLLLTLNMMMQAGVPLDTKAKDYLHAFTNNVYGLMVVEGLIVVCAMPDEVNMDDRNRPHSRDYHPALVWSHSSYIEGGFDTGWFAIDATHGLAAYTEYTTEKPALPKVSIPHREGVVFREEKFDLVKFPKSYLSLVLRQSDLGFRIN